MLLAEQEFLNGKRARKNQGDPNGTKVITNDNGVWGTA